MIKTAKQARAQAESNQLPVGLAKVEKLINKATSESKTECFCAGLMAQIMVDALLELGYEVEQQQGRTKISWGG